jgi:hypothetical protein
MKKRAKSWIDHEIDRRRLAFSYDILCDCCRRVRSGETVIRLRLYPPMSAAHALGAIALGLLPREYDACFFPDEMLFVGEAPVRGAGRVAVCAHSLIADLAVDTLQRIVLAASQAVPNPVRAKWPRDEHLDVRNGRNRQRVTIAEAFDVTDANGGYATSQ